MPWDHKAQVASNTIFLPYTEEPIHSSLHISQQGTGPDHYLCKTGLSIQQWFNNQSCIPEKCCDSFLGWTHGSWFPKVFWKCMCQKVYRSVSVQAGLHFSQLTDSCAHECLWLGCLESCVHISHPSPIAFMCSLSCTHLFAETGQEAEGTALQTGKAFQNLILELS